MSDPGIVQLSSPHSVTDTINRLESILYEKGIRVFARIDQSREAESAGLQLRPTQLLIFGNPKAGTSLMQQSLTAAIDLPLKIVAVEDDSGQVWILFNRPEFLRERHNLDDESLKVLGAVTQLATAVQE